VFRSEDGLDEISTTSKSQLWVVRDGEVTEQILDPQELGIPRAKLEQLIGGDAKHNVEVARRLFAGEDFENAEAVFDIVTLNAAGGMVAYEIAKGNQEQVSELFSKALQSAKDAITSGAANRKLINWSAATQQI
jgi:anthranilate phosphoribosyltransferase